MTHAYSESYLNNAKDRLSSFFDYAINDCKLKPDWITAFTFFCAMVSSWWFTISIPVLFQLSETLFLYGYNTSATDIRHG